MSGRRSVPVPPDAVRVWRGYRHPALDQETFFDKLGSIFIPGTVQIQAPVGLTAYLPSVLPADKPEGAPDEIAVVFYRVQQAYHDAKLTVGGRAYSDLHGLVFDLERSTSGFPVKLSGEIEPDMRYHLFDHHVDWQEGVASAFVGMRKGEDPRAFMDSMRDWLLEVQAMGEDGPDGAITVVARDHVTYWEHWPDEEAARRSRTGELDSLTRPVYRETFPRSEVEEDLWARYEGVAVNGGESFDFRFRRHTEEG